MSADIKGFVVALEKDVSEERAEAIANAIRMVQGVARVEPSVADTRDFMNREQVRHEMRMALVRVLYPERFDK